MIIKRKILGPKVFKDDKPLIFVRMLIDIAQSTENMGDVWTSLVLLWNKFLYEMSGIPAYEWRPETFYYQKDITKVYEQDPLLTEDMAINYYILLGTIYIGYTPVTQGKSLLEDAHKIMDKMILLRMHYLEKEYGAQLDYVNDSLANIGIIYQVLSGEPIGGSVADIGYGSAAIIGKSLEQEILDGNIDEEELFARLWEALFRLRLSSRTKEHIKWVERSWKLLDEKYRDWCKCNKPELLQYLD